MKNHNSIFFGILFGFLMVFLFAFMAQERLRLFEIKPLSGFINKTEMPKLTKGTYQSHQYQEQIERHLSETFGFREPIIRIYNQYLWWFYRKSYCHFIVPGKEGWLYYKDAFDDYYGIEAIHLYRTYDRARDWARKNVRMMNKLRYVLKDYGVEFLCFMAPNKAEIYPEYLPYHSPAPPDAINTAAYYDSLMTDIGFPHVEMTQWFKSMKDTASFLLFPKRDMHWRYSAAIGYDSLFSFMDHLNGFGIPDIQINGLYKLDTNYLEVDEQTLNLLFPIPNDSPKYRVDVNVINEGRRKPRVLFIGDSFINDLETYLPWRDVMEDVEIWFYNTTVIKNFSEKQPITEINRLRSLLNADYVIWYSSGHQWGLASYDFVEDALLRLCVTDSLFEAQIPWVIDSLRNDSAFSIRNKASQKLDSYNDTLRKYAIKAIKDYPELIPGLNGEAMPTIRNTKAIALAQQANLIVQDKLWLLALEMKAFKTDIPLDQLIDTEAENIVFGKPLLRQDVSLDTVSIIQFKTEKLIQQWLDSQDMVEYLKDKAIQKGKTFETVLQEDARWVVNERLRNGELF